MSPPIPRHEHIGAVRRDVETERRLGELAARLVPVACDLVCRVRDHGRDAVAELLAPLTADERQGLLVVLAAMVPDDRSVDELLGWVSWDEHGRPLGPAAPRSLEELRAAHTRIKRDRVAGRTPSDDVVAGERAYQRARKRRRRRTTREEERLAS